MPARDNVPHRGPAGLRPSLRPCYGKLGAGGNHGRRRAEDGVRDLHERLGQAKDVATIGRAVIDEVRSRIGASACLFLPLADGGQDLSSAVAYSDELPERDLLVRSMEMAPGTTRDFGTLEQHLARECRTVDFHRLLGQERLERQRRTTSSGGRAASSGRSSVSWATRRTRSASCAWRDGRAIAPSRSPTPGRSSGCGGRPSGR